MRIPRFIKIPLLLLILALACPLSHAATNGLFVARLQTPVPRPRLVQTGALRWNCRQNQCQVKPGRISPGEQDCIRLVAEVGPLTAFGPATTYGRPSSSASGLSPQGLAQSIKLRNCNMPRPQPISISNIQEVQRQRATAITNGTRVIRESNKSRNQILRNIR